MGGSLAGERVRPAAGLGVVGAENVCHLGVCAEEVIRVSAGAWRLVTGLQRGRPCDDFRLAGLKLIFLIVTRAVSVLGLSGGGRGGRTPRS